MRPRKPLARWIFRRQMRFHWPKWRARWTWSLTDKGWMRPNKRYRAGWHPMWAYFMRREMPTGPRTIKQILSRRRWIQAHKDG